MKRPASVAVCALVFVVLCAGCVERKILIRSEPPGAPVWVDEQSAGVAPAEYKFQHYGVRRIRVGPVRDEQDRVRYLPVEREQAMDAPWYETFPVIDFFTEVIVPWTVVDEHLYAVTLKPATGQEQLYGIENAKRIRAEGEAFRTKALAPVPELEEEK